MEAATGATEQARTLLDLSRRLSSAERRRGSKVIYALDSNILQFLSQPSEMAATRIGKGKLREGMGEIFSSDPGETQELVAHALAEHLYMNLRPHGPFLVIPPVTREIHDYAKALASRTVTPTQKEMEDWARKGDNLLNKLKELSTYNSMAELLIHQVQEVLFLLYGPPAAAKRLRHLLSRGLVVNSDAAAMSTDLFVPVVRDALHPFRCIEPAKASRRADDWLNAGLRTTNESREKAERRDAALLVRLEQINRQLSQTCDHRIVYVTADRNLLEVVARDGDPLLELHHPRAWLTRLQIFERRKPDAAVEAPSTSLADLLKLVAYEPESDGAGAAASNTLEGWSEYLNTATAAFIPAEEAKELFFDEARDMLDRYSVEVGRFYSNLAGLKIQAWKHCFELTAVTAAMEAQQTARDYARSVPSPIFEEWKATDAIINTFLEWHRPEEFDQGIFDEGLERINNEDPTGYAQFIALATIFASRGEWDVADSLIKRAFEAKAESPSKGGSSGREASFLEAVCRRHLARSVRDLGDVEALLGRAEHITKKEYGSLDAAEDQVVPARYRAERIATDITRFYFDRYDKLGRVQENDQERLAELASDLENLLEDMLSRLEAGSDAQDSPQEKAVRQLIQRTIINLLGLALVADDTLPQSERAYREAEKLGLHDRIDDRRLSALTRISILAYRRSVRHERSIRLRDSLTRLLAEDEHSGRPLVFHMTRPGSTK